jgi:glutathione S-transferase
MAASRETLVTPTIVGRSSSHFTRVTRIFAVELGVECSLQVVPDLMSIGVDDYGENPALRVPTLRTSDGPWFGALNVCRQLARLSALNRCIVWPEALVSPSLCNAQELVLQAMATEVTLVMTGVAGNEPPNNHQTKLWASLRNSLSWLDANARAALASLPLDRDLSYLEVTLFCLITHLAFRNVLPVDDYRELNEFCRNFSLRPSAAQTQFRFDT